MSNLLRIGLENAAAASVLALLAYVVSHLFRRSPALIHACWLLVLLKLITPPIWGVPLRSTPSLMEQLHVVSLSSGTYLRPNELNTLQSVDVDEVRPDAVNLVEAEVDPESATFDSIAVTGPIEMEPASEETLSVVCIETYLLLAWGGGSALVVVLTGGAIRRLRSVLRLAKPVSEAIAVQVEDAALRIGLTRPPQAFLIDWDRSPVVCFLGLRPSLILPIRLWDRLDSHQREALLIHEMAHLKRGDHLVRWLELVVSIVFWWVPALWLARRSLREAEEACCDAWVLWALPSAARCYADTLVETVEFLSESQRQPSLLTTGFGHVRQLKRRLEMIMRGKTTRRLGLREGAAFFILSAGLLPVNLSWAEPPATTAAAEATDAEQAAPTATVTVTGESTADDTATISATTSESTAVEDVEDQGEKLNETAVDSSSSESSGIAKVEAFAGTPSRSVITIDGKDAVVTTRNATTATASASPNIVFNRVVTGQPDLKPAIAELQETLKELSDGPSKDDPQTLKQIKAIRNAIDSMKKVTSVARVQALTGRALSTGRSISGNRGTGSVSSTLTMKELGDVRAKALVGQNAISVEGRDRQVEVLTERLEKAQAIARRKDDPTVVSLRRKLDGLTRVQGVATTAAKATDVVQGSPSEGYAHKVGEQEKRLSAMERKLEQVLDELKSLQKHKDD